MKTSRTSTRKLAVGAAIAAGTLALGAGAAFADQTATTSDLAAGQTICVDLATDGSSGFAQVFADSPVRLTVLVKGDGASDFTLVSENDAATSGWRAEFPGETGYVVRVVRACAQNVGDTATSAFLTVETDDNSAAPVAQPAAEVGGSEATEAPAVPDAVIVDDSFGGGALQSAIDQVEAQVQQLVAELAAAVSG